MIWDGARNDATRVADVARTLLPDLGVRARRGVRGRTGVPLLAIPFPAIDPVLIAIGPFAIRWYALAYIAGIVLGWRLVRRLVQRPGWQLTPEAIDDLVLRHAGRHPGRADRLRAVLSARLLSQPAAGHARRLARRHVLPWRSARACWSRPSCSRAPQARLLRADRRALAVATPIGLFLGRIANFINAELWGRPPTCPGA